MSRSGRATNAPDEYSPFTHRTVSVGEAAAAAGVTAKTIYRWVADNRVLFIGTTAGKLRIYRDSLFDVPRENTQTGTS
jgi:excisionase family DNA binding protein